MGLIYSLAHPGTTGCRVCLCMKNRIYIHAHISLCSSIYWLIYLCMLPEHSGPECTVHKWQRADRNRCFESTEQQTFISIQLRSGCSPAVWLRDLSVLTPSPAVLSVSQVIQQLINLPGTLNICRIYKQPIQSIFHSKSVTFITTLEEKAAGFVLWGPWLLVQNYFAIHAIVV